MNPVFGNEALRTLLSRLMRNETLINEVVLEDGGFNLMGVSIQSVQGQYVVFNDAGSGGLGTVYVVIDKIVAIDA